MSRGPVLLGAYHATFLPPGPERSMLESGGFEIRYTAYDWSLNGRR